MRISTRLALLACGVAAFFLVGAVIIAAQRPEKTGIVRAAPYPYVRQAAIDSITVTKREYGSNWPFRYYSRGILRCHVLYPKGTLFQNFSVDAATIEFGGLEYGLNAIAMAPGRYKPVIPLFFRDQYGYYKYNKEADEILEKALTLCRG